MYWVTFDKLIEKQQTTDKLEVTRWLFLTLCPHFVGTSGSVWWARQPVRKIRMPVERDTWETTRLRHAEKKLNARLRSISNLAKSRAENN